MTRTTEPTASAGAPARPPSDSGRSASTILAAILLSRIAGLIRQRIFARFFGGNSEFGSAFITALRMPNVLQNLLGEGTLSASFIPAYSHLLEKGEHEAAGRLAGAVFALLLALTGALALLGILLAPWIVYIIVPWYSDAAKAVAATCIRIVFPMTGLLVLSAWALGVLNSHKRFFLPYFAPVLWNGAMIATLLLLGADLGDRRLAVALAWGALLGGALQFAIQLPRVIRLEPSLRVRWDTASADVRHVLHNAGPAILGRGSVQLSSYVDVFLTSALFDGALLILQYAQTLYVLPVSLFGMSVAAAELPEMSRRRDETMRVKRDRLEAALRRIALLIAPSAIGFIVLGDVIVDALYRTGAFGASDSAIVVLVLIAYTVGLPASTSTRVYASTLYALDDTRTPARIAFLRVAISALLGAASMLVLERWAVQAEPFRIVAATAGDGTARPMGVLGLAGAAGLGAWIEWSLLRRAVAARIGAMPAGRPVRVFTAALLAALAARALDLVVPGVHSILRAVLILGPFGVLYFAIARALGVPEVGALFRSFRRARERRG